MHVAIFKNLFVNKNAMILGNNPTILLLTSCHSFKSSARVSVRDCGRARVSFTIFVRKEKCPGNMAVDLFDPPLLTD